MKKTKKLLCLALVLLLVFTTMPTGGFVDFEWGITASALKDSGKCGKEATYTFNSETGELVISGTGAIADGAFYDNDGINNVIINEGITEIGAEAFSGCYISSILIPSSVTSIGYEAFWCCYSLRDITIPEGVTTIGERAFYNCYFTELILSGTVKTIGSSAFESCNNLTSVIIPEGVTTIESSAFRGCTSIEILVIPKSVTYIGSGAFDYCTSLYDVYYLGTKEEWNAIEIGTSNSGFDNAPIHFGETYDCTNGHLGGIATCANKKVCIVCGENYGELEEHIYNTISYTDPTCTKNGEIINECINCGHTETETIDAYGHDIEGWYTIDKEATCTTEGIKSKHCSRCDYKEAEEKIPAYGHSYDNYGKCKSCGDGCPHTETKISYGKPAGCTYEGYTDGEICALCGFTIKEQELIPAIGHEYKEVVTPATCTEDGYSTFTCGMCGSYYVGNAVKAYGHKFDIYYHDEGSATCYMDGTKTAECANGCSEKNTVVVPGTKTGHEMTDFTVITAATCTASGEKEAKCFYYDKCGYSELVLIDTLDHSTKKVEATVGNCYDAGNNEYYACENCDKVFKDADAKIETTIEAERVFGPHEYEEHVFPPTCYKNGYSNFFCTVCDSVYGIEYPNTKTDHVMDDVIVITSPTCTTNGECIKKCIYCDYTEEKLEKLPALGHDYPNKWSIIINPTCEERGVAIKICFTCNDVQSLRLAKADHEDLDGNRKCDTCDKIMFVEPEEETTTEAPSEEETTTSPFEEETTTEAPSEEETTTVPFEEETTTEAPYEEETTTAPYEEETTTAPYEEETTEPENTPEPKPCDCDCHAGGIKAFFFKFFNFFAKIFDKSKRTCKCGAGH